MDWHFYSAFPVCWSLNATLQHLSDSTIHTLMAEAANQGASCSSGGSVWGRVSCSRALRHAARRSRDSNQRLSDHYTTIELPSQVTSHTFLFDFHRSGWIGWTLLDGLHFTAALTILRVCRVTAKVNFIPRLSRKKTESKWHTWSSENVNLARTQTWRAVEWSVVVIYF